MTLLFISVCGSKQSCSPLQDCQKANELNEQIKEATDFAEKIRIIQILQELQCGDGLFCCDSESEQGNGQMDIGQGHACQHGSITFNFSFYSRMWLKL